MGENDSLWQSEQKKNTTIGNSAVRVRGFREASPTLPHGSDAVRFSMRIMCFFSVSLVGKTSTGHVGSTATDLNDPFKTHFPSPL